MADLSSKAIKIVLPVELTTLEDKYRRLYAAMEAVRLKHNTREGDMSGEAIAFRSECLRVQTALVGEILELRPSIADTTFKPDPEDPEVSEPNHPRLKGEGKADFRAADLKAITGVDLDAFSGVAELPPDPLEVFTPPNYTEIDSENAATVTANKVQVVNLSRIGDLLVYRDCGADHFSVGWTHYFKLTERGGSSPTDFFGTWAVTNQASSSSGFGYWYNNQSQAICLSLRPTDHYLALWDCENQAGDSSNGVWNPAQDVPTYCAPSRTGETTAQCVLHSDAAMTVQEDLLAVAVTNGRRHRYVVAATGHNASADRPCSYDLENLDLNEAAVAVGPFEGAYPLKGAFDEPWR